MSHACGVLVRCRAAAWLLTAPPGLLPCRAHLADTYEPRPPSIVTSAQAGYGRSELLGLISQLLQLQQRQVQQQGPAGS